jgi:hypothetical protein
MASAMGTIVPEKIQCIFGTDSAIGFYLTKEFSIPSLLKQTQLCYSAKPFADEKERCERVGMETILSDMMYSYDSSAISLIKTIIICPDGNKFVVYMFGGLNFKVAGLDIESRKMREFDGELVSDESEIYRTPDSEYGRRLTRVITITGTTKNTLLIFPASAKFIVSRMGADGDKIKFVMTEFNKYFALSECYFPERDGWTIVGHRVVKKCERCSILSKCKICGCNYTDTADTKKLHFEIVYPEMCSSSDIIHI